MNHAPVLLHLSLIESIGPATIQLFIEKKTDTWKWSDLYQISSADLHHQFGFSLEKAEKIVAGLADNAILEKELAALERYHINFITLLDDAYPDLLKHIHLPPAILYCKGAPLDSSENYLAVVGSRKMNRYGKMVLKNIIPPLVESGFSIISGGAIGVDSYAHQITVESGGKTVVVLGSGLVRPYPYCNKKLFEDVLQAGGTLVSPFSLHTSAYPGNFPARNRIIAGLSRGCLVVQAAHKSGARITANFALEQGRDVFAIPGAIDDDLSRGCHDLIQQGAKLVQSSADILEEYGIFVDLDGQKAFQASRMPSDPVLEQIVSSCLQPTTLDELTEITGLNREKLNESLFELQLQGFLCQQMGLWQRC